MSRYQNLQSVREVPACGPHGLERIYPALFFALACDGCMDEIVAHIGEKAAQVPAEIAVREHPGRGDGYSVAVEIRDKIRQQFIW